MLMVLFAVAWQVYGNLNCVNSCKSCSSGYNYLSISCLSICPSGYLLSGSTCTQNSSQELFTINFAAFRRIEASSIETFSHPEGYSFRNESKVTPIPTLDRGFYFFSSSFLVSNTSWVLAPRFCISILFKAFSSGKIFEVSNGSTTYLSVNFTNKLEVGLYYFNKTQEGILKRSLTSDFRVWRLLTLVVVQYQTQLNLIFDLSNGLWFNSIEFRMDTDQAKFMLGAPNNSSFQGFLAYLTMKNSLSCYGNFLLSNPCGFNQYLSAGLCINCSNYNTEVLFCIRNSSNLCFSNSCNNCSSYMFENCSEESTEDLAIKGRNCETGSGFNCTDCKSGFSLSQGLCIFPPSNPSKIVLRLDDFEEFQGGFFQSGVNSSTYSPFNNPEKDDPIAMSNRGYYFASNLFMRTESLVLNHSFTVSVWAYMTSRFLINSEKFRLMSDSSVVLTLANHEIMIEEFVPGNCNVTIWSFFGVFVEWKNNLTQITTFCNNKTNQPYSVHSFAFYDAAERKNLSAEWINNFVYRITFSQFIVTNLNDLFTICSFVGDIKCLGSPSTTYYTDFVMKNSFPCDSNCTRGCSTWGTCNQCKHIQCETCGNFNKSCELNSSYQPCVQGFHLSEDNKTCCRPRCAMCYGYTSYACTKCEPGYVLVGTYCAVECPTHYTLNAGVCVAPAGKILMNATFDKIADNFNDVYGNTIFTASSNEFYPTGTLNDPIPVKSRGYYFSESSYIYTSNFSIPFEFSYAFWIWQSAPGILLTKGDLQINSSVAFKYLNRILNYQAIPIQTWYTLHVGGCPYYHFYRFWIRDSSTVYNYYDLSEFTLDDISSPIYIGSSVNGFTGFLWRFMIYNYINTLGEKLITCNETFFNKCYWNCSLNQYIFNNSCQPCLNNCTNGCVRATDCNLCHDPACYECEFFNNSCKKCITNASKKSVCECDSGFYWKNDSISCMPCVNYCSKCNNSETCQVCNINFTKIDHLCHCNSNSFIEDSSCLPCHELCLKCVGPFSNNCTACPSDKILINNSCVCKKGFYLSEKMCIPCPRGCLECLNATFCTSCDLNFTKINENSSCPNANYSNTQCCENCHRLCNTCNGPSEFNCLSCGFNRTLTSNGTCPCSNSFYEKDSDCIYCDPLQNLEIINNKCVCMQSFYYDNQKCMECHNSCKACNGSTEYECLECKDPLTKMRDLCLCQPLQYWNGTSCETCDSSLHLIADNFECKCKDGYFTSENKTCEPCNLACLTCFGDSDSECLTCGPQSYLNNSKCLCEDNYYHSSDFTCQPCPPGCEKCIGPTYQDCLCEIDKAWSICQCLEKMFWNLTCQPCDESCQKCSGSQYFMCTHCDAYYLSGICYDHCPRGFNAVGSECILSKYLSLGFYFDSFFPMNERFSNKSADLRSKDSAVKPFPLENRGMYFPEHSESIIFDTFPTPFVSPTFFISIWLKVMRGSEVFSINSSEVFRLGLAILEKNYFYLRLNQFDAELQFEIICNSSVWHIYVFGVVYSSRHSLIMMVDGVKNAIVELPLNPYKDSLHAVLSFGGLGDNVFSGFIYSFEIFTSEPLLKDLFVSQGGACGISPPSSNVCLDSCTQDEYFTSNKCEKCDKKCIYGCLNATHCSPCFDETCEICNTLEKSLCFQCRKPYQLRNGKCIACEDSKFFNNFTEKCETCPNLCLSCLNESYCISCKENSSLNEFYLCTCKFGYKIQGKGCLKQYFEARLAIDFSNSVTISFNESLKSVLAIQDLSMNVNSEEVRFFLNSQNLSLYYAEIIINDMMENEKDLTLFIIFSHTIVSVNGASLKQNHFQFKMFSIPEQEVVKDLETLKDSAGSITIAASASALASGVLLMNPTVLFNFLNLVEMFSYTLLFDVHFHLIFIEFMLKLKKSTKLPSLKLSIKKKDAGLPEKYALYEIESSLIIINFGLMVVSLFSVIIITLIAHLGSLMQVEKLKVLCIRIKKFFFFRWFNRFLIQGCFDCAIFCFLSLKYSDCKSMIEVFDFCLCCFLLIYIGACFLVSLYIIKKSHYPLLPSDLNEKVPYFSCILDEFNCIDYNKCYFYLIFISRRVLLSALIVYSNQILQLTTGISFALINILYLLIATPFVDKKENYIMFFNEAILLVFYFSILLAELRLITRNYENLAVFNMWIVIIALLFNILINIIKNIICIVSKIKSKCIKKDSKVVPIENLTSVQKIGPNIKSE